MAVKTYSLNQFAISDREILLLVDKALDGDGYAESAAIAKEFWPRAMSKADSEQARSAVGAVSSRLSYMARELGIVMRDAAKKSGLARWTITEEGQELLDGRLRAAVERGLDEMDSSAAVIAMSTLSQRSRSDPNGMLLIRAFRYGSGKR